MTTGGEELKKELPGFLARRWDLLALISVLALALALMLKNSGHILSFDEAWNVVTVNAAVAGKTGDLFFFNFYRHPPVYLSLSILLSWIFGTGATVTVMKSVSMLSGLGIVVVLFATLRKHTDRTTAVFGAFFLAVMPAVFVFDTWVKQDALAVLFSALFVYFFLARRYWLAGIFMGLGILTKEIAAFALIAAAVYTVVTYSKEKLRGLGISVLVPLLMGFWWFIFYSNTVGDFSRFFFGTSPVNALFRQPWSYYVTRLPTDLSWVAVVFLIVGCLAWLGGHWGELKEPEGEKDRGAREDVVLFAAIWFFLVLGLLTFSVGKPVWMIYSAGFPAAVLAAAGLRRVTVIGRLNRFAVAAIIVLVVAGGVSQAFLSSHDPYMEASGSWGDTLEDHRIAMELNRLEGPGQVLLMSIDDISPELAYYLDSYSPDSVASLPRTDAAGNALERAEVGRTQGKTVYLVDGDFPLPLVLSYVEALGPEWVLLKDRPEGTLSTALARDLETMAPFMPVDRGRIFYGPDLWGR